MAYQIINPRDSQFCYLQTAQLIAGWIKEEAHGQLANMLAQNPEKLLEQIRNGWTLLATRDGQVVGHVTLWTYQTPVWGELGSLIVAPEARGLGIGKALSRALVQAFPGYNIIATTKTSRAHHVICLSSFSDQLFTWLQKNYEPAWRECCPCFNPPEACPKRDQECALLAHLAV